MTEHVAAMLAEVGAAAIELGYVPVDPQPLDESLFFEVASNGVKLALHTGYLADKHKSRGALRLSWHQLGHSEMLGSLRVWSAATAVALLRWLKEVP